jgi:hypothetical protein
LSALRNHRRVGPVALERFANKTNKVGWNGLPFGVKLLIIG